MTTKKIMVVGSTNTDMVVSINQFPSPGETILGKEFFMNPGGKGANQAVAAIRLGGMVTFLGKIGNDFFGIQAKQKMQDEGIDVSTIFVNEEKSSGVALITVNSEGENSIVVAPGANGTLCEEDIDQGLSKLKESAFVLLQLEIPLEVVDYVAQLASEQGVKVILNPAPATKLSDSLLSKLSIITPNEIEAEIITGIKIVDENSAYQAAKLLKEKGIEIVIITLGALGAFVLSEEFTGLVDSPKVTAVDTTAAGDTFNGALVVALAEEKPLKQAVEFACKAASFAVTKVGAQASVPYRKEVFDENSILN